MEKTASQLKETAVENLTKVDSLLEEVIASLCDLEGNGYANIYEEIIALRWDQLAILRHRLISLKEPSGVFRP